jgi:hypothetical protein
MLGLVFKTETAIKPTTVSAYKEMINGKINELAALAQEFGIVVIKTQLLVKEFSFAIDHKQILMEKRLAFKRHFFYSIVHSGNLKTSVYY